jgi:hypothetical protein
MLASRHVTSDWSQAVPMGSLGSAAAETWLVSVSRRNLGRLQHCGTSIIGLPVSFLDLSFEGTGLAGAEWVRPARN